MKGLKKHREFLIPDVMRRMGMQMTKNARLLNAGLTDYLNGLDDGVGRIETACL
jgi:hypothetical protein